MIVNGIVVPERQLTPSSPAPITAVTPVIATSNQQDAGPTSEERVLINQTLQQASNVIQRAARNEEQSQSNVAEVVNQESAEPQLSDANGSEQVVRRAERQRSADAQTAQSSQPTSEDIERRAQLIVEQARQSEAGARTEARQTDNAAEAEQQDLSIDAASPQAVDEFEQIQTISAENQADLARIERIEQQRLAALRLAAETLAEQELEEQLVSSEQAEQDSSALDVVQQQYAEEVERAAQLQQNLQPAYQRLGNLIDELS